MPENDGGKGRVGQKRQLDGWMRSNSPNLSSHSLTLLNQPLLSCCGAEEERET